MGQKFGQFLRKLREDRKFTLQQIEELAKVSNAYLSQVERGKRGVPHFKILQRLAGAYGVSVFILLQAVENEAGGREIPTKQPAPDVEFVLRGYERLGEAQRQELKKYLQYLTQQERRKRSYVRPPDAQTSPPDR